MEKKTNKQANSKRTNKQTANVQTNKQTNYQTRELIY